MFDESLADFISADHLAGDLWTRRALLVLDGDAVLDTRILVLLVEIARHTIRIAGDGLLVNLVLGAGEGARDGPCEYGDGQDGIFHDSTSSCWW